MSLAFLAEVTGRGYQREGFSGFLRAVTVTERAIARSVDCECPISAATSVRAIALRLGNSVPYTDTSRLVPRPFCTLDPGSELPSLSATARTEDERSESEVAAEIGHSQ